MTEHVLVQRDHHPAQKPLSPAFLSTPERSSALRFEPPRFDVSAFMAGGMCGAGSFSS